jgi:hypothetical protein
LTAVASAAKDCSRDEAIVVRMAPNMTASNIRNDIQAVIRLGEFIARSVGHLLYLGDAFVQLVSGTKTLANSTVLIFIH